MIAGQQHFRNRAQRVLDRAGVVRAIQQAIALETVLQRGFGVVSHLFSTGANDVLVARGERERMIPFVQPDFIRSVDFDAGVVTVDWDAEF